MSKMSANEVIDLVESDEQEQPGQSVPLHHRLAVEQVASIMHMSKKEARLELEKTKFNVEETISRLLEARQPQQPVVSKKRQATLQQKKPPAFSHSFKPKTQKALFQASAGAEKGIFLTEQPTTKTLNDFFVDSDFPPTTRSLDGRQRTSAETGPVVVKCKCGVPAAARTVQSDGPNYGRFYLACGLSLRRKRRAPVLTVRVHNPYAKATAPESPPQREKCDFFQWDPDGSKGASGSGYLTGYSLLSWQHFGIENGCVLVKKEIGPSQVRQGAVGNCWFLSALAVVAEKPYLVKQLLPLSGLGLNDNGVYQINLCMDGAWTPIIVDSNLPVVVEDLSNKKSNKGKHSRRGGVPLSSCDSLMAYPAFCAVPDQQLWPALVEKAYAKAHGSYAQLSGGFIAEGLNDLTGAPTETIVFSAGLFDRDELWARLLSFHEAGFLMGVATSEGGDGLVGGHAYSLLDVIEVHDSVVGEQSKMTDFFQRSPKKPRLNNEVEVMECPKSMRGERTTVRLVRIRNPWGNREWKGDWSADSVRWTKALRNKIGTDSFAKGDGTFFMSFDDMLSRFHHMDVAKTQEGWCHTSESGIFRRGHDSISSSHDVYELTPSRRTMAYISIMQPKKRSNVQSKYWYGDPSFLVLKRKPHETEWSLEAACISGVSRSTDAEVFLDPAMVYCCLPYCCLAHNSSDNFAFRVVCYSASEVSIKKHPNEVSMLKSAALSLLHRHLLQNEQKPIYHVASRSFLTCVNGSGCVYLLAVNGSEEHYLSLRLSFDIQQGMLMGLGSVEDTYDIPPRSQKVVAVVCRNGKFSTSTELRFRYLASAVPRTNGTSRTPSSSPTQLGSSIDLSMAGDLLCSRFETSTPSLKGGGTIETYMWIPQIGCGC